KDIDRIGVKLRELAQSDPTAAFDFDLEGKVVNLPISRDSLPRNCLPVHHDFDEALAASHHLVVTGSMQKDCVADRTAALTLDRSVGHGFGYFWRKGHARMDRNFAGSAQ